MALAWYKRFCQATQQAARCLHSVKSYKLESKKMLTKQDRKDIISKFQQSDADTGSPSVQIALITERIRYISEHLKQNPKDFAGERGLTRLVGQRKRLLAYLKKNDFAKYQALTKELKLRK